MSFPLTGSCLTLEVMKAIISSGEKEKIKRAALGIGWLWLLGSLVKSDNLSKIGPQDRDTYTLELKTFSYGRIGQ